ncbi:hypothetical protein I79_004129 [Cricetulus griseus]|uniref:Uncharacterized protein n=1 Tax=Cricetulus griseus TaxID=10029 RepID=G3H1U7_CRIGR|nr:hypothetical protein I79_004129 [Cricetulus griseus]
MSPAKIGHPRVQGNEKERWLAGLAPTILSASVSGYVGDMKFLHRPYIPLESNL